MNFIKKRNIGLFICLLICLFVFTAHVCSAQSLLENSASTQYEGSLAKGDFTLNDFTRILIRATEMIFGLVGSLSLLMFIYGGVMFLVSSGSSERVTQAKQIITGAVIGLAIVFTSYMIIGFIFRTTGADPGGTAWSTTNWFK